MRRAIFIIIFLVPLPLFAQEAFGSDDGGFGFGDSGFGFSGPSGFSVSIGGEVKAELKGFFDDMGSIDNIKNIRGGDIFSGSLNFEASGSAAQGVVNLNVSPAFDGSSPVEIDEAFVRAFFGPVAVEGGLRKLTWGKADSFGPLDVINPLDYTDLTNLSDPQSIKIARPMIHASWSMGSFSKLEGVFVPWFQGHTFATSGRWAPGQITALQGTLQGSGLEIEIDDLYPDTGALEYAQGGTRFTTSMGSSDFGFQYYFGRLPRPAVNLRLAPMPVPEVNYNSYHQIGVDFARVTGGFNLRAEAGANITNDLDGTDGATENPALLWSLGFDRDLFAGVNLNLQGTGKVRLFHDKIGSSLLEDCEAGSDASSTRITGIISRKFLRDELELKASALWGIEDKDFLVMPALVWSRNDVSAEVSAGFFGGDKKGELGQYRDNGFVKVSLSYCF